MLRTSVLRRAVCALALLGIVLLTACVQMPGAASPQEQTVRSVNVTGEAEVRVVPDEVIITFGVETNDTNLAAARAASAKVLRRVDQGV